jgi:hypothetical protein
MCTLSLVRPNVSTLSVVMNRDEDPNRPTRPPAAHALPGGLIAIFPQDARASGTWIGVNSAGLIACIMNASGPPGYTRPRNALSRGEIVPKLLACDSLSLALRTLESLEFSKYPLFRVVLADVKSAVTFASAPASTPQGPATLLSNSPLAFASSGLGDSIVQGPRLALFAAMMRDLSGGPALEDAQAAFHRHRWSDQPHVSVVMSREHARTVSRTSIVLTPAAADLVTEDLREDGTTASIHRHSLPILIGAT